MKKIRHALNCHKQYLSKQFILFIVSLALFLSSFLFTKLAYSAAPMIWQSAQYGKMLTSLGFKFNDDKEVRTFTVDPSAGAGVAAPIGSYGTRDNAGVGEFWFKYGAADTNWSNVTGLSNDWSLIGNAGTTPGTNFLGTTDAQDLQIRTNNNLQQTYLTNGGWISDQTNTPADATVVNQYTLQTFVNPAASTTGANFANTRSVVSYDNANAGFDYNGGISATSSRTENHGDGIVDQMYIADNSALLDSTNGTTNLFKGNNLDVIINNGYTINTYDGVNSYLGVNASTVNGLNLFNSNADILDSTVQNAFIGNHNMGLRGTSTAQGLVGEQYGVNISDTASVTNQTYGQNIGVDQRDNTTTNGITTSLINTQVRNAAVTTNVISQNVGLNMNDTANASSATAINTNPNIAGSAVVGNLNTAFIGGVVEDTTTVSNFTGLGVSPVISDSATVTNFTPFNLNATISNTATVTNGVNIANISLNSTPAIPSVKGVNVNLSNANVTDPFQKHTFEGDGGSVSLSYNFTVPGAQTFFQNHFIGGGPTVALGDPTNAYGFGTNMAQQVFVHDDWGPDVTTLRLGFVNVGFVGNLSVDAGKTMDSWTGALSGFGIPSGSGTVDQAIMFRAAGGLPQGGTITANELVGFEGMPTLCGVANNCWGVRIEDPAAFNLFAGAIQTNDSLILQDPGAGVNSVTIKAPTLATNYTLTLPVDDGTNGQSLTTDGNGVLSWASGSAGWGLTGNSGTNATTNFLGTTDTVDLVFRTDNTERLRITSTGSLDTTLGLGLVHSDASGILTSFGVGTSNQLIGTNNAGTDFENKAVTATAAGALTAPGALRSNTSLILEDPGAGTNTLTLQAGTIPSSFSLTLPTADGTDQQVLTTNGSGVLSFTGKTRARTNTAQSGTTYTFALTDGSANGNYPITTFTNSSPVLVTVPLNSSVAFPIGTQIDYVQEGSGLVTISPAVGVTINSYLGYLTLMGQNTGATLIKTGTDTWDLVGQLGSNNNFIVATGGTITTDGDFKVHTFTSSGTFQITSGSGTVESLVVAGGGSGGTGNTAGGGGGAGGLIYTSPGANLGIGSYTVTVGAGGAQQTANADGNNGGNSQFNGMTAAVGGGGGGGGNNTTASQGQTGGSGGGAGGGASFGNTGSAGTAGQGNAGGNYGTPVTHDNGGGGGGAGTVGGNGNGTGTSGNGGNGLAYSISGTLTYYAGGGGGGQDTSGSSAGAGGLGGGGAGTFVNGVATAGTNGLGGGGGGGSNGAASNGGAGGSGVVILRYRFQNSSGTNVVFGSRQTGRNIVAATGITAALGNMSATVQDQVIFVEGTAGVDITANPQIQAHTLIGAKMIICGTDDTNFVKLDDGNGLALNGSATLGKDDCITLMWTGSDGSNSVYTELSRSF